jgi:hypothetical protein
MLALLAPRGPGLAGGAPPAERLQLRLGALAEDPRVAGQTGGRPLVPDRFYERRSLIRPGIPGKA